jgi:hypothetical protein
MSAFGGKAVIERHAAMSANDPKRTLAMEVVKMSGLEPK